MISEERVRAIEYLLFKALHPEELIVEDESASHVGHAGAQTGMGHFAVRIRAPGFEGKSLPERHRMVYDALSDLMETDIHALRIQAKAPGEE